MKKLILSVLFLFACIFVYGQNTNSYIVTAFEKLEAKKAFVIGGDDVRNTTQLSVTDTTLVTKDYLKDSVSLLIQPFDYIQFDTTYIGNAENISGRLLWSPDEQTLQFGVQGGSIDINKEIFDIYTDINHDLAVGNLVSVVGVSGGRRAVAKTNISSGQSATACIGVVTEVLDGWKVRVTEKGKVHGLNTISLTEGLPVYGSAVNGVFTQTLPAANKYFINVGLVEKSHVTDGIIHVEIRVNPTMKNLSLTNGTPLTTTGQFPVWHNAEGYFDFDYNINNYIPKTQNTIVKDPSGFQYPEQVVINYNSTNRTITLTGNTTAFWQGDTIKALVSGWTSSAHTATSGPWYLYYNGTSFVWSQDAWTFDMVQIAYVNYNQFAIRESHGLMPYQNHQQQHQTVGTYLTAGGDISDYVLNSNTAADRRPLVSSTSLMDEDNLSVEPALTSESYTRYYLSGSNTQNFQLSQADIVPLSGNQPYYNQFTGGSWQQTLMSVGYYQAVWLVALPVTADAQSQAYRYVWVQGQSESNTLSTIQALSASNVNLGALVGATPEIVFVGKIIIQYIGGNWKLISVEKITGNKGNQTTLPAGNYLSTVATNAPILGNGTTANPIYADTISTKGLATKYDIKNYPNWNTAYDDKINSLAFSGTTTKTLTLTQQDGGTVTGSFTDIDTDTNTTYSHSAETTTGGANLRLTGSDATNDDVKFAGSGATTVTRTDANTITISSTDTNTDQQTLSIDSTTNNFGITISNGNRITFDNRDGDSDPTNELDNTDNQTLSFTSPNLSISGGNTVNISGINTDNQNLSNSKVGNNVTVNISGGTGTTFSVADADSLTTNELNNSVSWNNTTNEITVNDAGGNKTATITGFLESEVDGSVTNEAQSLSVATNTITLSQANGAGGGSVTIAGGGINTVGTSGSTITITGTEVDGSITNEIQDLSRTGDVLNLSSDPTGVDLSDFAKDTDLGSYLPLSGGTMGNTNLVTNMNADLLDGHHGSYYQPLLTNPVTGTGRTNFVTKFVSTGTIGESQIYDDGTNVAIGHLSPQNKLDVLGSIRSFSGNRGFILSSDVNTAGLSFLNYGVRHAGIFSDGTDIWWANASVNENSSDNWTKLGVFKSSGEFGVNTIVPTQMLDVNGNARFRGANTANGAMSSLLGVTNDGTLTTNVPSFEPANSNIQQHITNDADLSITNEIQDFDKAQLVGDVLQLSLSQVPDQYNIDLSQYVNDPETDPIFTSHTTYNISNGIGLLKNNGAGVWSWDNNSYSLSSHTHNYEPTISSGTITDYWRGDKTWQTLNTAAVPESGNLYFTNTRARTAISLTTLGNSGASTYDNTTGIFNIPNYTLSGLGGVPTSRTLTINGNSQDLSADRTWTISASTPQSLIVKFNTGTTEGTDLYTFNGSAPKTFDIKAGANTTITTGVGTATIGFNEQYAGTVTSFSSGNLSPLFTTSVATPTTTPALSFSLNTQAQKTFFAGPVSGVNAAPTFRAIEVTDIPTLNQNTTGQAGSVANSVTFNNGGSGGGAGASGTTYNGSEPKIISYNTIGAEPTISAGTTSQYWRGDKTWQTLNTNAVTEGSNLYYTDARSRTAISLTTNGSSGAATYSSSTGVLNVPNYSLTNTFSKTVTQTTHGFSTGDWIRLNGTTYTKAIANAHATADVIGVVTNVADANTFTYQYAGIVSGAYAAGQNYFLSTTTAGAIGAEESYTAGQVRQFVGTGLTDGSLLIEIDIGLKIASAPTGADVPSGSNYYIQNQNTSAQNANMWISGEILGEYSGKIALSYSGGALGDYHKGFSGRNQNTNTARGLHIFNYDNDGNQGINFWTGTYANKILAGTISADGNTTFFGNVSAPTFQSTVATGTQPYATSSTTLNTNLNADLLDGQHGSYYTPTSRTLSINGTSYDLSADRTWSVTANTTNSLTINNSGTGDASGSTFNGSAAKTISYNSIGATPADLPATLSTDHTYLGTTIAGTAGENLVFGDFVYFKFSDLKWWKASASAYATARVRGVVVETINTNATGKILIEGEIRDDTWNWTAAEVWLSTTSGAGTSTQPSTTGNQIQFLGTALSADHILFKPSQDVGEK